MRQLTEKVSAVFHPARDLLTSLGRKTALVVPGVVKAKTTLKKRLPQVKSLIFSAQSLRYSRTILILAAYLLFIIGIISWTQRNIQRFEKETIAKVNEYMVGIAREKAQYVEQFAQELQDYLALLARKPFSGEFKPGRPISYNDYLAGEALLEHIGGRVDSIYRLDKKGTILYRMPYARKSIGKNLSNVPEIQAVLQNHTPQVGDVFEFSPGNFGFHICHPVFDEKKFLGALCLLVRLDTLNQSVCHLQSPSAGAMWIINRDGLIVSHSDPDFIGKNILEMQPATASVDSSDFDQLIQKMKNGEEGFGSYDSIVQTNGKDQKVRKAFVFLPITLNDQTWSIAMTTDYEEIAAPVRINTRNNFIGAILMMLALGGAGLFYHRNQKRKAKLEAIARWADELRLSNEKLTHEIEQRNRAEMARDESENNYRLLAENVMDIIWLADLQFRFTYISPSLLRVLGLDPEEALGSALDKLLSASCVDAAKKMLAEEADPSRKHQTAPRAIDAELQRKNGSTVWTETRMSLLRDPAGAVAGLLGVTRDITEKMQLQQQFIQAQKMESIGTMAGGIAHDFNNLLGGILGYATLLKTKIAENEQALSYTATIEKSANRAAELTAQLLAFARGGKFEPKVVALDDIVKETAEIITRTFNKLIEIKVELDEAVPTVEADPGQLQQALLNLCVNARDAMPDGGKLTIRTRRKTITPEDNDPGAKPGVYCLLSVSDTGMGMNKKTLERIFEPFFTTKEKGKGTGLGLAMVYGVVKKHGGHIRVQSEPGRGAQFQIFLPASGKTATKQSDKQGKAQGGTELILVVDDEEVVRFLSKDALESFGYKVLTAKDGLEAIDIFKRNNGDIALVIIDMVMPKLSGRETFLKLKELNPKVKALLSTGFGRNGEAQEILDCGVMGLISKPFRLEELLVHVRDALDSPTEEPISVGSTSF